MIDNWEDMEIAVRDILRRLVRHTVDTEIAMRVTETGLIGDPLTAKQRKLGAAIVKRRLQEDGTT